MSILSVFLRKPRDLWYRSKISRRHALRRHLAYYVARRGFEIGDYSFGWPVIHFFKDGVRLKVGKYCSIAGGTTIVLGGQHHTDTVTSFPLGRVRKDYRASDQPLSRGDTVVGSDVWLAANALILGGVTISDGAVVGAGSVVIQDVAPYTIVFGNPARAISKRFPDEIIAELLELRWWDLPDEQVLALRPLLESTDIEAFIAACRKARCLPPKRAIAAAQRPSAPPRKATGAAVGTPAAAATVVAIIQRQSPGFSAADLAAPFERLGLDSFGMLVIRTEIEEALAVVIDDAVWGAVTTPAGIVQAVAAAAPARAGKAAAPAAARRHYNLNMPQMVLGGLSESWLFKELGDIHWSMITSGLGSPSHLLQDANGDRLYATFTRIRFDATSALTTYTENERLDVDAKISRYGAGMFFSSATAAGDGKSVTAQLMSSFSKIGEGGSNKSLLRGQPEIPPGCDIPALADMPAFGLDYRERRAEKPGAQIFETEYDIVPSHDINGVGLLYFAAYPTINDICATRYAGRSLTTKFSTQQRDVFYFSNSDPDETLVYRLHRWDAADDGIAMEGSISRKSDGVLMAYIKTAKKRATSLSRSMAAQAARR